MLVIISKPDLEGIRVLYIQTGHEGDHSTRELAGTETGPPVPSLDCDAWEASSLGLLETVSRVVLPGTDIGSHRARP